MKTLIILYWQRTLSLEEPKESFHSTLLFKRNGTKVEKGQMTCPMSTGHTAAKPGCTQVSQLSSISAGLSQGQCCSQGTPELSGDNFGCHRGRVLVARGLRVKVSEAYRFRVALPAYPASLTDVSLVLSELRPNDSGIYRCEVQHGIDDSSVTGYLGICHIQSHCPRKPNHPSYPPHLSNR